MTPLFYTKASERELEAVSAVLASGQLVMGPHIEALEREIGSVFGDPEAAVCCASGTDALSIALETVLGYGEGQGVIVPSMTFSATYEAVLRVGYTPIICDVDESLTPTVDQVRSLTVEALNSGISIAGVVLVHLYGWPARHLLEIAEFCKEQRIPLIEDAAQAFGASRQGKMVGTFGDAAIFSFYPTKPLGGIGDGGAVYFHNNLDGVVGWRSEHARALRNHGRIPAGYQAYPGFNSRMDETNAAVLRDRLSSFGDNLERRRAISARYHAGGLKKLAPDRKGRGVPYVYPILVEDRDKLRAKLATLGFQTGTHYDPPLCGLSYTQVKKKTYAGQAAKRLVTLPCHHMMTETDADRICDAVRRHRGKD